MVLSHLAVNQTPAPLSERRGFALKKTAARSPSVVTPEASFAVAAPAAAAATPEQEKQERKNSSPRNWRAVRTKETKINKDDPSSWNAFSSCKQRAERDAAKRVEAMTPPKGSSLVPLNKGQLRPKASGARRSAPGLSVSSTGYKPPHLRLAQQQLDLIDQQAEPRVRVPKPPPSPSQVTFGPLKLAAREIFERAHGLNGIEQEDMETLKAESMAKYGCSEKAFMSLVLGHSYDEELAVLRAQVPGYVSKKDARRLRSAARKAKKRAARSCQSSPSTLPQRSPAQLKPEAFDLSEMPDAIREASEERLVGEGSISESFGTPSHSPPAQSPTEEGLVCDGEVAAAAVLARDCGETKKRRLRKMRSQTEPKETLEQHGGVGTWRNEDFVSSEDEEEVIEADQDMEKPVTLLAALSFGAK